MLIKYRFALYALLLVLLALIIRRYATRLSQTNSVPGAVEPLKPTEQARVTLSPHAVTTITQKGVNRTYVPSSGTVTVSVQKNGEVQVHVKEAGFGIRPGIGVIYADQARLSGDLQLAFYGRFGLHCGIGLRDNPIIVPFVGGSYRLDQIKLPNTSLMAGKMLGNRNWFVGIRVEL